MRLSPQYPNPSTFLIPAYKGTTLTLPAAKVSTTAHGVEAKHIASDKRVVKACLIGGKVIRPNLDMFVLELRQVVEHESVGHNS